MAARTQAEMFSLPVSTGAGTFVASYSDSGLARLDFPAVDRSPFRSAGATPVSVRQWHRLTAAAVKALVIGKRPGALPPLDLKGGTDFQQSVWKELRRIKPGGTRSYTEIARRVGRPKAARAVGGACGANPIPLLIPCHRVLATHQRLGGFSGGLKWKKQLLTTEGVTWAPQP